MCLTEGKKMAEDNIKYKALISWIKHDEGIRKRVFDELFRQVVFLGEVMDFRNL